MSSFAVPTDFSNTGNTNYEPIPADNHVGVCVGVLDLGTHMESYQGGPPKPQRKIKLQFELPGVTRDDGKAGIISATFNNSMNEKATLRKMLDNWLGADWPEKYKGRPWSFLIGQPAMVNVQQGPGKRDPGRTVAWIGSVSKYPKGMPVPQPTRETFYLDLSNKELPPVLSVWDAKTVRQSKEYLAGGFRDDAPTEQGQAGGAPAPGAGPAGMPPRETVGAHSAGFDETADELKAPAEIAGILPKYGLCYPYSVKELEAKQDVISPHDMVVLNGHSIPF